MRGKAAKTPPPPEEGTRPTPQLLVNRFCGKVLEVRDLLLGTGSNRGSISRLHCPNLLVLSGDSWGLNNRGLG